MGPIWMVVVAALMAVEKILPWRRMATYGVTIVLFALGALVIVAPRCNSRSHHSMRSMR